jgi:hypothetical protein
MRSKQEIEKMENVAAEEADNPKLHGMTYEDGVRAALEWVLDESIEEGLF